MKALERSVKLILLGILFVSELTIPNVWAGSIGDTTPPLLSTLQQSSSYKVRLQAVFLLGDTQRPLLAGVEQALFGVLDNESHPLVRAAAVRVLEQGHSAATIQKIFASQLLDPHPLVRATASEVVANMPPERVAVALSALYNEKNSAMRDAVWGYFAANEAHRSQPMEQALAAVLGWAVLEAGAEARRAEDWLMRQNDVKRRRLVTHMMRLPGAKRRHKTMDWLEKLDVSQAIAAALQVYQRPAEHEKVIGVATRVLRQHRHNLDIAAVIQQARRVARNPQKSVIERAKAIELLGIVGGDDVPQMLIAALHEPHPVLQAAALRAIAAGGHLQLQDQVEQWLSLSTDPSMQLIATRALARLIQLETDGVGHR